MGIEHGNRTQTCAALHARKVFRYQCVACGIHDTAPKKHQPRTCPCAPPPLRVRCSRAMTAPNAACRPARLSPRLMLGRTGGRSGKPFRYLEKGMRGWSVEDAYLG